MAERHFLKQLKYIVIDPNVNNNYSEFYIETFYDFWSKTWEEVFNKTGSPSPDWKKDFFKANRVSALMINDEVASISLHSFYNITDTNDLNSKYLSIFSDEILNYFTSQNLKTVMSQEYLTVSPKLRGSKGGACIGELAMILAVNLSVIENVDFTLGTPIVSTSVLNLTTKIGGTVHPFRLSRFGYELGVVSYKCANGLLSFKNHNTEISNLLEQIWNSKLNLTSIHYPKLASEKSFKIAA